MSFKLGLLKSSIYDLKVLVKVLTKSGTNFRHFA